MPDPARLIYKDAPLKLVAFQIQFPQVPILDSVSPPNQLVDALRTRYPILGGPPVVELDIGPGQAQQRTRGARFMNRLRTWTVTVDSGAISVETSRYQRYERFAAEVAWVLERVHAVTPIPAVIRLGLRYIDEIEIEGVNALADWKDWIHHDLLVGGIIDDFQTNDYIAQASLELDALRRMTVRYGRVSQPVVNPDGVLKIYNSPTGPYFLLDIDSFWEPSRDEFLEYDAGTVNEVLMTLHEPVRVVFERAITQALRERFGVETEA